jgi:uncharacterized protein
MSVSRRNILRGGAGVASAALLPSALSNIAMAAQKEVTAQHLTAPAGIGEYEWGLGIDRLLKKHSSWFRTRSQPTQGYIFNLKTVIDSPDRDKIIFNTDYISPDKARNKDKPFTDGLKGLEVRGLMNCIWPLWFLMTKDPDLKSVADIAGKNVALGAKAGTATVMAAEALKAAGMHDKVDLQYLSFRDIPAGLIDGTIDVGLMLLWYNAASHKISTTAMVVNVEATKQGFHYLKWPEGVLQKTKDERGIHIKTLDVPNGSLPLQTEDLEMYVNPDFVGVSKDFPEEWAYEYVKHVVGNLNEINAAGGLGVLFTPEFLPLGIEDNLHPGARRAYKEAGLI